MPRRKKGTDKKKEPKKGGESGGASGAAAGKSRTPNSSKSEHRDAGRAGHVSSDSKGDEVLKRVKQNKDADLSAPVAPVEVAEGEKEGDRLRSVVACMCQCVCVISVTIVLLSLVGPRVASFLDPDRELLARATDSDLFKSLLANLSLHIPPRPGVELSANGAHVKHPVIIVPGVTSTALELWKAAPCLDNNFRKRVWGDTLMMETMLLNFECWMKHIRLHDETGLDPDGIRVRAAEGISAADVVASTYTLWSPLVEELAAVGYDPQGITMASFDWRLSLTNLEVRDHFYTRLKSAIERMVATEGGNGVVLVGHSMGCNTITYFFQWLQGESASERAAGAEWIDKHIHAFINVGGPMLGTPKALAAALSGEARDTAGMHPMVAKLKDLFFISRKDTKRLMHGFDSGGTLLPVGGSAIWGGVAGESAPDAPSQGHKWENMVTLRQTAPYDSLLSAAGCDEAESCDPEECVERLLNATAATELLREAVPSWVKRAAVTDWDANTPAVGDVSRQLWGNTLAAPLPMSPNLRIYCLYGVGLETERAYVYADPTSDPDDIAIDTEFDDPEHGLDSGIWLSNGDGTVPLLSLGYMCRRGWHTPRRNPGGVKIVTRERPHGGMDAAPHDLQAAVVQTAHSVYRGGLVRGGLDAVRNLGGQTADHVDILLNVELMRDIITIATGHEELEDVIVSDIDDIAERVADPAFDEPWVATPAPEELP